MRAEIVGEQSARCFGVAGGGRKLTYCKQDEVLLVVLAHAVIDPGTVVVHLPDAPLANTERAKGRGSGLSSRAGLLLGDVGRGLGGSARSRRIGDSSPGDRPAPPRTLVLFTVEIGWH